MINKYIVIGIIILYYIYIKRRKDIRAHLTNKNTFCNINAMPGH